MVLVKDKRQVIGVTGEIGPQNKIGYEYNCRGVVADIEFVPKILSPSRNKLGIIMLEHMTRVQIFGKMLLIFLAFFL